MTANLTSRTESVGYDMLTTAELATILNALRYYCQHNEPHVHETTVIARLEEWAESAKSFEKSIAAGLESWQNWKNRQEPQE